MHHDSHIFSYIYSSIVNSLNSCSKTTVGQHDVQLHFQPVAAVAVQVHLSSPILDPPDCRVVGL